MKGSEVLKNIIKINDEMNLYRGEKVDGAYKLNASTQGTFRAKGNVPIPDRYFNLLAKDFVEENKK